MIAGWDPANLNSNPHKFYQNVFAPACRTCHIAQPFGAPDFTTRAEFEELAANNGFISSVQDKVCTRKVMPHAQRTNDVFWQSLNPNMPAFLELYASTGGAGGRPLPGWAATGAAQCGLFFQDTVATSVFQSQILRVLQTKCGSCHGTANTLANFGVNQAPATVFGELRNATAKDGSKYIDPKNSGTSKLFQRISTGVAPQRMPQNQPPLDTVDSDGDGVNDQQGILNWITAGAPGP